MDVVLQVKNEQLSLVLMMFLQIPLNLFLYVAREHVQPYLTRVVHLCHVRGVRVEQVLSQKNNLLGPLPPMTTSFTPLT